MRSVSTSAWRISSKDSARVYFASLVQPLWSCSFACRKYWLIAVSSAVSCSIEELDDLGVALHRLTLLRTGTGVLRRMIAPASKIVQ